MLVGRCAMVVRFSPSRLQAEISFNAAPVLHRSSFGSCEPGRSSIQTLSKLRKLVLL